ncbi:sensor histidine kinase [Streptomyces sp. NPDC087420]|uniref:sensor histidine kinase n=1 Tax=Streptomyces sp. NPDC087420 TaxID=3365785 RepID=UPI0038369439
MRRKNPPAVRRTHREKTVDLGVVLLALALTGLAGWAADSGVMIYPQLTTTGAAPVGLLAGLTGLPDGTATGQAPFAAWTVPVGFALCLLLWWRRRWPAAVAGVTVLLGTCAPAVAPAIIALHTATVLCTRRTVAWVGALAVAPLPFYFVSGPSRGGTDTAAVLVGVPLIAATIGWGLFVRSLHERTDRAEAEAVLRAERAEADAVLRAERAQQQAREDTAREMHDVLAHRLSLLSVHAGALEFHPDAPAADIERAAGVIRESAHQALEDLQVVLRVLRTPLGGGGTEPPQPTLADVRTLVAEARAAGMDVELDERIARPDTGARAGQGTGAGEGTGITGRTAYRIVQEGLTNARKHAHSASVRVTLHGGPHEGLSVDLRNRAPRGGSPSGIPGTGQGLIGLTERAVLAGGKVTYGRSADDFLLQAWLPWPA